MTKEKMLDELNVLYERISRLQKSSDEEESYYWNDGRYFEALDIAIKALEREPIPDDCEILTKEAYSDLCLRAAKAEREEITDDGTLVVNTANYDKVKRVLVQQGTSGSLFYPEEDIPADIETAYARGYNNAKREIALSGEYERAFQRGYDKAKAEEECEDYIDRKELMKWMKKFINDTAETGRLISLGIVDEHIREMPSVKPKHVFAHWSRLKGTSWYKCQNCDYKTDARHNFCPRCGCQMEGDLK